MCTQMCSLITAGFGGQRDPSRVQGLSSRCGTALSPTVGDTNVPAYRIQQMVPGLRVDPSGSASERASFALSWQTLSQVFLAGNERQTRGGVGWVWCTDSRCKWGPVVSPQSSFCFSNAFSLLDLCNIVGIFSCLISDPCWMWALLSEAPWWSEPGRALSWLYRVDECTQKLLEGSANPSMPKLEKAWFKAILVTLICLCHMPE